MLFIKIPAQVLGRMKVVRGWAFCSAALLTLLLAGCIPAGPRALLRGKELIEKGQAERAVPELRTATELMSTNAHAWNYLGLAYHHTGKYPEAANAYRRALQLNHDLAEARFNLGESLMAQGQLEAARTEFMAYTLRRPNSVAGLLKLSAVQLRTRDYVGAEKSANTAVQFSSENPETWNALGLARVYRGRSVEAMQCFDQALKIQPDFRPALLNSALVLHQQLQNPKAALPRYRRYVQLKPTPVDAAAIMTIIRQLESSQASPKVSSGGGVATNITAFGNNSNPPPQSAEVNTSTVAIVQAPPPPQKPRAESNTVPVSLPPRQVTMATSSSPVLVQSPRLSAPSATSPPQPPIEAVLVAEEPEIKAATDLPAPRVVERPTSPTSVGSNPPPLDPTSILAKRAEPAPKKSLFSRLNPLNLLGKDAEKKMPPPKVITTAGEGTPNAASQQPVPVQPVPKPLPSYPRYKYASLGKPQTGDRVAAQQMFAEAIKAQQSGKLNESINQYREAVRLDPTFFEAEYNLGVALAEAGNIPEALVAYERALVLNPASADARYNLALMLKRVNYVPDAARELERMVAAHPNETRGHMALANLYAQNLGQKSKARQHYLRVLELEPQHPQAGVITFWLAENR